MGSFANEAVVLLKYRPDPAALTPSYDRYPLAVKLHLADLESTYLREKGTSAVRR